MHSGEFQLRTGKDMELVDISADLAQTVAASGIADGVLMVFSPHTTAGITINEGADPAVRSDIVGALREMLPVSYPYRHLEGNSPSHVLASLMGSSVAIIISGGVMRLGTWQKVFFCEFDGPRTRKVWWRISA